MIGNWSEGVAEGGIEEMLSCNYGEDITLLYFELAVVTSIEESRKVGKRCRLPMTRKHLEDIIRAKTPRWLNKDIGDFMG